MKNLKNWLLSLFVMVVGANFASGQIYEVPLESRIHHSQLIIEGKVVDAKAFIPEGAGNIFTSYLVEITQTLKGESEIRYIQILEKGGTLGDRSDWVSHRAPLYKGLYAVFFCRRSGRNGVEFKERRPDAFELYSGAQGIIFLQGSSERIHGRDAFHQYRDIRKEVYQLIDPEKYPKLEEKESPRGTIQKKQGALGISSFSPQTITGGTRSVLTIRGTDFGTTPGTISFYNADNGGVPLWVPTDRADILSWEDTLITCWVPSIGPSAQLLRGVAGTGPLKVETSVGDSVISSDTLNIQFSIRNLRSITDSTANYHFLLDTNGMGGYTFRYSQSFSNNSNAVKVLEASLKEWRCKSGVNFVVGNPTQKNVITEDGTNIIKWNDDPSDSLKAGQLAQTTIRRERCLDGNTLQLIYYVYEIDIVFKDTTTLFIDTLAPPPNNKIDFYTVALHELGHAHLLNHVVADSSIMYYGTSPGRSVRTVDADQLDGANWVMDSSVIWHSFCPNPNTPNPMIRVPMTNCNIIDGIEEELKNERLTAISVFPNPTYSGTFIQISGNMPPSQIDVQLIDPLGRVSKSFKFFEISGQKGLFSIPEDFLLNGTNLLRISSDMGTIVKVLIRN